MRVTTKIYNERMRMRSSADYWKKRNNDSKRCTKQIARANKRALEVAQKQEGK